MQMRTKSQLYRAIIADPPWEYRNNTARGGAGRHYPTMSLEQLCSLPIQELAAKDCLLVLWATWPQLPEAMALLQAWGFMYKTGLPWIKTLDEPKMDLFGGVDWRPKMGNGFWLRGCSELILLAIKGKVPVPAPEDRLLGLLAPTVRHSRKPDSIHALVERMSSGPYLELFARRPKIGWDVFGNEVEGSIQMGALEVEDEQQAY